MTTRIAFCITDLNQGGAERQFVELITRLPRDRFDPSVIALSDPPQPPEDRLLQQLRDRDVPVTFLLGRGNRDLLSVWRGLSQWLRDFRPALLQCFLAHANVLGAYAGHRAGVPHIVTGIRVAEQRLNWHVRLQRRAGKLVDTHVCLSNSVANFAESVMQLPREKLLVIYNGVDVARFAGVPPVSNEELDIPTGRRIILFLARLDPQKRPDWLLDRMPEIARQLPTHDLVLAGKGPLRGKLERQAIELGLRDLIHFIGWRPDVAPLLAASDLLVLTSDWEGMPNAIFEAMAAARSVVVTEVHGVVETLGADHGGQITPRDDPQQFVDAVVRIAGNPELASQLGRRNQERVASEFSFERTVEAYVNLYNSLLSR